jgi:hypothetical protein
VKCELIDNGQGMSENLIGNFFLRSLPESSKSQRIKRDLEGKRGEGSLIAYSEWELLGGKASVFRNLHNCGTTFSLSIPAHFFKQSACPLNRSGYLATILTAEQKNNLDQMENIINSTNGKTIMLVDDGLLNLKILLKKIWIKFSPIFSPSGIKSGSSCPFMKLEPPSWKINMEQQLTWQKKGFVIDIEGNCGIICAANGTIAFEIAKYCSSISATITDDQMPGDIQGMDLINLIRGLETKRRGDSAVMQFQEMKLSLNTAAEAVSVPKLTLLASLDAWYILKSSHQDDVMDAFLKSV